MHNWVNLPFSSSISSPKPTKVQSVLGSSDASSCASGLVSSVVTSPVVCAGIIIFFFINGKRWRGSKPKFQTDGRGRCQRRHGREAGYKVGPSERQTTHS